MSVARRPLLTATAAGTLLCALWFVPSANATAERQAAEQPGSALSDAAFADPASSGTTLSDPTPSGTTLSGTATQSAGAEPLLLAETGSVDTAPYVIGGTACLGIGAGFVAYSMRRGTPGTV